MPDATTSKEKDARYSLAEAAILSEPWLSTETSSDVLAQPELMPGAEEPPVSAVRQVVIRRRGPEITVEIQAIGPTPRSLLKSVEEVADLLSLPAGWNSYSAKPIAPANAVRAIRLLADLLESATPPPIVVPTVRGGIQLEWHTEKGDIEIYIKSPENVTFFAEDFESGESVELPLAGHEHDLKRWVGRVSAR